MEKHCFTADIEHEDQRIDRYLTEMLPEQSRSFFQKLIFMLVDALLFVCQLHIYSICISIGIMLSAGLQLPYIFKELRKMLTN